MLKSMKPRGLRVRKGSQAHNTGLIGESLGAVVSPGWGWPLVLLARAGWAGGGKGGPGLSRGPPLPVPLLGQVWDFLP